MRRDLNKQLNLLSATPEAHSTRLHLMDGTEVFLPAEDDLYEELIHRNQVFIKPKEQDRLRRSRILIAGTGAIGGAVIELLVRTGAERLTLAEPDCYEFSNANRQSVDLRFIGVNKAQAHAQRMAEINPYADIQVVKEGIATENVSFLVGSASIIVDGVDVTQSDAIKAKCLLHWYAKHYGIPVVSGYDMAGTQLCMIYDYRSPQLKALDGKVREDMFSSLTPRQFTERVVPVNALPYEMIEMVEKYIDGVAENYSQLGYCASMFGVIATRAILDLLMFRPVRKKLWIDVPMLLRTRRGQGKSIIKKLVSLRKVMRIKRRLREDHSLVNQDI